LAAAYNEGVMPDMAEVDSTFLNPIIGESLGSVTFVMDYIQLDFNGPRLTALTLPVVRVSGKVRTVADPGWRDSLCERIGASVRSAYVRPDDELSIAFEDGSSIVVSLRAIDYRGPEAINFTAPGRLTVVF
jgi:hypothetical protein